MENKKTVNYQDIVDGWKDAGESYYLLENSVTKERFVYKGFEGLSNYVKWKRMYGAESIRLSRLDKAIGEVLYGNEIQD
jgi:hypothetical protein